MNVEDIRDEGGRRTTGAKSTRKGRRDADARQTENRSHGDKLKNEESRRKHYRSKVRVGKEDHGLSKQDMKALSKKKKQGRKQIRREIAGQNAVRRKTSDALDALHDDNEERSTGQDVFDTAESVAFGMVETVEQEARNAQYSKKLHERAKKLSEEVEAGKKGAGSNELSKEMQKKRIRKEMTEATRKRAEKEAANEVGSLSKKFVDKAEDLAGKLAEWIGEHLAEHPLLVIAIVAIAILLMVIMTSLSSCSVAGGGMTNVTIATSYTAQDETIRQVEQDYKDLEADLQTTLNNIERDHPGYDEYRYDLSEIGHNAHSLAALLTVLYEDYTRSEVQSMLQTIFDKQYELTLTEVVETRTRTETRTGYRTVDNGDGTTSVESYTYEVEVEYEYYILKVKLTNKAIADLVSTLGLTADQLERYEILKETYGNKAGVFGSGDIYSEANPGDYQDYDIPAEALTDQAFAKMINEAEKYLGYPYVWGGSSPSTSFDCSGFVSYVINHCGNGWNVGRQTANGLLGKCSRVSASEAKPGDLIFFQGTYATSGASHVGIYVGNGMMIHCGNPIQYASINSNYWQSHFYTFGRIN